MAAPIHQESRLLLGLIGLADISGYTSFVRYRSLSLSHAEMIVTELMEGMIDAMVAPWVVNKLEGDAALLYAEISPTDAVEVGAAVAGLTRVFAAFDQARGRLVRERKNCGCDACTDLNQLRLKILVHSGEMVLKRVRQFEELAGDAVILLHRLAKNDVPIHEYLLLTDAVMRELAGAAPPAERLQQTVAGWERPQTLWYLAEPQQCAALLALRRPPAAASPSPSASP
ncbi:MAG: hypothetical protein CO182_03675, partial [Lysobacterales bacterium CG_4_9_14_3_um_filter_62_6]